MSTFVVRVACDKLTTSLIIESMPNLNKQMLQNDAHLIPLLLPLLLPTPPNPLLKQIFPLTLFHNFNLPFQPL